MEEKKLTEEEVIKALEWASKTSEWTASVAGKEQNMFCAILDLINRQKAEIERLTKELEIAKGTKHRLTIFDRIEIHGERVLRNL